MAKEKTIAVPFETVTVIDGTEYIVHTLFSPEATETVNDKLKRLILNNVKKLSENPISSQ